MMQEKRGLFLSYLSLKTIETYQNYLSEQTLTPKTIKNNSKRFFIFLKEGRLFERGLSGAYSRHYGIGVKYIFAFKEWVGLLVYLQVLQPIFDK